MCIDFDKEINRRDTNDLKWRASGVAAYLQVSLREDMIPMWIADMDFACPPAVVAAVKKRAEHEIYGYCSPQASFANAVRYWLNRRFNWDINPSFLQLMPTVVASINVAIQAFTPLGGGVIIQQPVYDPFATLITRTGRKIINNGLVFNGTQYEMDFDLLEKQAAEPDTSLLILCSPHNPVGRVWRKDELLRLDEICRRNNVLVVADEIHADIIYSGNVHIPFPTLSAEAAQNTIYCMAPSKTFNIPGLKVALAYISNLAIKEKFVAQTLAMSLDIKNTFGIEALPAAYSAEGEAWLNQLLLYLEANLQFVQSYIAKQLPEVTVIPTQGTFLCWLDFSKTGLSDDELLKRVVMDMGIVCVPGPWFGAGGNGHLRLNIACTRKTLETSLARIKDALMPETF